MCGITGLLSLNGAPLSGELLRAMCDRMRHRGPDDAGFYMAHPVGLAMRRLSIIDIATGRQPIANEDESVWAVFNGEIYNHRVLRRDLEARGHRFKTHSDTEVIVHLYEEHGRDCVGRLRGMFGLAIWDRRTQELLLARDRLGIKPLYYAHIAGTLAFASELKPILLVPGIETRIDDKSLVHLLAYLTTPHTASIVPKVEKLAAGHRLIAGNDGLKIEKYWDVCFAPNRRRSPEATAAELWALLQETVRLHMEADVPLGAFLSGGVDSSSVVAAMATQSARPVKTFSIGFSEKDYDELAYARVVAKRYATDHHELMVRPDALSILDKLSWYLDEPFGDSSAIPTFLVSELAAQHVTVVLSGDGGDELFAGYDKYAVEKRERSLARWLTPLRPGLRWLAQQLPDHARGRRFLAHYGVPTAERRLDASTLFTRAEQQRLLHPDIVGVLANDAPWQPPAPLPAQHWLSAMQYRDLHHYLPLDILTKVDRMSMAHSIEARVPLLDHVFVEFAATIPPEQLLRGREGKWLFKQALAQVLPSAILMRRKQGFAVPLGRWFRGELRPIVDELLLSRQARKRRLFNPSYVQTLVKRHAEGRPLDLHLWILMSVELWCRAFLDPGPAQLHHVDPVSAA